MNKILLGVVVLIIIGLGYWFFTSSNQAAAPAEATPSDLGTYAYECDEHVEFTMTPASDMSTIYVVASGGGAYPPASTLMKKESASGVRYEGNGIVFAGRGETITLNEGDSAINCSPVFSPDSPPFNFGD